MVFISMPNPRRKAKYRGLFLCGRQTDMDWPRRKQALAESEPPWQEARAQAWIVHQCPREAFEAESPSRLLARRTPQPYIHAPSIEEAGQETTSTGERIGRRASVCGSFGLRRSNVRCQSDVRRYRRAAESYGGTARAHPAASGPIQSVFNRRAVLIRDHLHQRAFGIGFVLCRFDHDGQRACSQVVPGCRWG